jgi:hypothetical protein
MRLVERLLDGVANIRVERPAYRESLWQAYLSRGDCSAYQALETASSGCSLGELIAVHRESIEESAHNPVEGSPIWQFVTSAPTTDRRQT